MSTHNVSESKRHQPHNGGVADKGELTTEEHFKQIAETAYYLAEQRGFVSGHEVEDWLQAEELVNLSLQ
jgi:hypothetical protein